MLSLRIKSALVLGPVALFAAWFGSWAFVLLAALAAGLIGWEWARLSRGTWDRAGQFLSLAGVGSALVTPFNPFVALCVAAFCGVLAMREALNDGGLKWVFAGAVYVSIPTICLIWIREQGFLTLLWLLLSVWATDIGAYAAGRLIGGSKIAPSISPNKTWAGLLGGMVSAFIIGAIFPFFMDVPAPHWMVLGMMGAFLAQIAQCGDFAESAMKRHFGAKDSSNIIPGHGGVMDRLDGLLAAALPAALLCFVFGGGIALWP